MPFIPPIMTINNAGIYRIAPFAQSLQENMQKARRERQLKRRKREREIEAEERVRSSFSAGAPTSRRIIAWGRFAGRVGRYGRSVRSVLGTRIDTRR